MVYLNKSPSHPLRAFSHIVDAGREAVKEERCCIGSPAAAVLPPLAAGSGQETSV